MSHRTTQKQCSKKDTIRPISSDSFKVIFILLTNVVAVQIKIFIVEVEKVGLQRLLSKLCLD